MHALGEAQGVVERSVIEAAQVAAEPDEGAEDIFVQDKDAQL